MDGDRVEGADFATPSLGIVEPPRDGIDLQQAEGSRHPLAAAPLEVRHRLGLLVQLATGVLRGRPGRVERGGGKLVVRRP